MRANNAQLLAAGAVPLGETGGFSYAQLVNVLNYLVRNALILAGLIAVGAIVYYGVRMAWSRGESGEFNKAKDMLIKACIGAVIIFGVYTIIATVQGAAQSIGR